MFDLKLATRLIATKRIEKPNIYVRFWRFWSVWISESAWKLPELVAQADSLRLEFPQAVSLKGETGHLSGFFELSS